MSGRPTIPGYDEYAPSWASDETDDVVIIDEEEWATFLEMMLFPQTPTPSILKGAQLLRRLRRRQP